MEAFDLSAAAMILCDSMSFIICEGVRGLLISKWRTSNIVSLNELVLLKALILRFHDVHMRMPIDELEGRHVSAGHIVHLNIACQYNLCDTRIYTRTYTTV